MQELPSAYHQMVKFRIPWGIKIIQGEQNSSRECYTTNFKTVCMQEEPPASVVELRQLEKLEEVSICNFDASRTTFVGADLETDEKTKLMAFLRS